jgi:DNA-binding response OmpR family regulator
MKALVIENDPLVLVFLTRYLRLFGFDVTACPDGVTALDAYHQTFYSLVVVDVERFRGYGVDLCSHIRSMPGGERSIILALTGRQESGLFSSAFQAEADEYLAKPLNSDLLKKHLSRFDRQLRNLAEREPLEEYLRHLEQAVEVTRERMVVTERL